ncbi:flavoprotein [Actinomadura sp. NEAU-AAG7]|uniref:flavoprotein n=1 Tax=Actinomadura sp. NEAU-AAG7 TaxID=2839640 RepID=UPI001BE4C751|nr:flavoprotein [Actinomadura sp. NEAU-AAG7]MBT2207060.1 flavoprotein [Actinomadura sp. NEAU-AAG7]
MTESTEGRRRVLYIIVCAAGPAADVGKLVTLAQQGDWDVQIIATPSALDFIDAHALEGQTGRPVQSRYRKPHEPRSPRADAMIVAPATYNTLNKWANGIADTYALGLLAEAPGLGIPVVALPFINTALAARTPLQRSIETLQAEGIRILFGPDEVDPHDPGTGGTRFDTYPWPLALEELNRLTGQAHHPR